MTGRAVKEHSVVSGCNDVSPNDRRIVVSPRHDFIRSWMRAYFSCGNTTPLVIVPGPEGDWTEDDYDYCRAAAKFSGGIVFDCSSAWEDAKLNAERSVIKSKIGWYSKKNILHRVATVLKPKSWAWIDDDAEVYGNIDECFEYAEKSPGFVLAQFYYPSEIDNMHPDRMFRSNIDPGDKICWNSFVFFHGNANEMLSRDLGNDFPIEDDEIIFGLLYNTNREWHDGFCDISIREWQANCKTLKNIPDQKDFKVIHYTSHMNNGEVKKMWAEKASLLPPAAFEKEYEVMNKEVEDGPIDAVFVIGTGSVDNNEELRYALRNLEKNCPFIRDVYICGFCPTWIDRSAVRHLNWPDRFRHAKDANIIDKLRHACEQRGIARRILFCSDDQFNTRECAWEDFRPRYLRKYESSDRWYADRHRVWHTRLKNTLERDLQRRKASGLDENRVFYYQPHMWMQIDRDKFINYAKWCNYETREDTIIASGYFNFIDADGSPDFDHMFLRSSDVEIPKVTHVAYHDGSEKVAMRILKSMFPSKSRFELDERSNERNAERKIERRQNPNPPVNVDKPKDIQSTKADDDPSGATAEEMSEILEVTSKARDTSAWNGLLGEISRAEELRLFGVRGWRTVWRDIARRWRADTKDGKDKSAVTSKRSEEAAKVIERYMSDPDGMRTVRFGPQGHGLSRVTPSFGRQMPRRAPDEVVSTLRDRIRSSLRDRIKN